MDIGERTVYTRTVSVFFSVFVKYVPYCLSYTHSITDISLLFELGWK